MWDSTIPFKAHEYDHEWNQFGKPFHKDGFQFGRWQIFAFTGEFYGQDRKEDG